MPVHLCGSAYYECKDIKKGTGCQSESARKCPSDGQFRESALVNQGSEPGHYLILRDVP
jgi:hypothetical protein